MTGNHFENGGPFPKSVRAEEAPQKVVDIRDEGSDPPFSLLIERRPGLPQCDKTYLFPGLIRDRAEVN